MADTIQVKRSATAAVAPASLLPGELAANIADARLWVGDSAGAPKEIGLRAMPFRLSSGASDPILFVATASGPALPFIKTDGASNPIPLT